MAQIVASIREFGWTNPVLIDETDGIIAGHGRVLAALAMNAERVPCIVIEGLTEQQRRALMIADNKLALNADWDFALLASELAALDTGDFDMALAGFDVAELERIATGGLAAPENAETMAPQYQILIECATEGEQVVTLDRPVEIGIECRALVR